MPSTPSVNRSSLSGTNAVPAIIAACVIIVSVAILVAGIKLCGCRRNNCKKSKPKPSNASNTERFFQVCGHSTVDIVESAHTMVSVPSRRSTHSTTRQVIEDGEMYVNEQAESVTDDHLSDDSRDETIPQSQTQTVQVDVHKESTSNVSPEAATTISLPSASTPQNVLPKHIKPFRMTFVTEDAIFDIA